MSYRLLVIDDEEDYLKAIVQRLELRGIEVHGVGSGKEALAYLDGHRDEVDLVLLDVKMPGMGGIEVLRRIRRDHANLKVIMVTGHASEEFKRLGEELGAIGHLLKPIRLDTILERIEAALRDDPK